MNKLRNRKKILSKLSGKKKCLNVFHGETESNSGLLYTYVCVSILQTCKNDYDFYDFGLLFSSTYVFQIKIWQFVKSVIYYGTGT